MGCPAGRPFAWLSVARNPSKYQGLNAKRGTNDSLLRGMV
jgi:hypothetical protein